MTEQNPPTPRSGPSPWVVITAIGTLLGGLAAAVAVIGPLADKPPKPLESFYVKSCQKRLQVMADRSAARAGEPAPKVFSAFDYWCECTGKQLSKNFDASTVEGVTDWFDAIGSGVAERSEEDAHFAQVGVSRRKQLERAYDFASEKCSKP